MLPLLKVVIVIQCVTICLSIDCTDFQESTKGFGVYVERSIDGQRLYRLFNKIDRQWTINLTHDGSDIVPEFEEKSYEKFENFKKIFGTFNRYESDKTGIAFYVSVICKIFKASDDPESDPYADPLSDQIHCLFTNKDNLTAKMRYELGFNYTKPIVLLVNPGDTNKWSGKQFIVFDSEDKSQSRILTFAKKQGKDFEFTISRVSSNVPKIGFIEQMDDKLFAKINSMADYSFSSESGYMLWFHSDGKQFYCFQPEGQSLSNECSAVEKMRPFAKDCGQVSLIPDDFVPSPGPDRSGGPDGTGGSGSWTLIVIIILVVIVIICIVGVVFYLVKKSGNPKASVTSVDNKSSTSSQASGKSDKK